MNQYASIIPRRENKGMHLTLSAKRIQSLNWKGTVVMSLGLRDTRFYPSPGQTVIEPEPPYTIASVWRRPVRGWFPIKPAASPVDASDHLREGLIA